MIWVVKPLPQLRQIHGFDGAEILHPIDVVQTQGNDGQQQDNEPLDPHPASTFFETVNEFLNALGRCVELHVSMNRTTTPPA